VYRVRISGLESGRIQHILNKPDRIRTTVLFKFPDQDFQISFLEFDANTIIKIIFATLLSKGPQQQLQFEGNLLSKGPPIASEMCKLSAFKLH